MHTYVRIYAHWTAVERRTQAHGGGPCLANWVIETCLWTALPNGVQMIYAGYTWYIRINRRSENASLALWAIMVDFQYHIVGHLCNDHPQMVITYCCLVKENPGLIWWFDLMWIEYTYTAVLWRETRFDLMACPCKQSVRVATCKTWYCEMGC